MEEIKKEKETEEKEEPKKIKERFVLAKVATQTSEVIQDTESNITHDALSLLGHIANKIDKIEKHLM